RIEVADHLTVFDDAEDDVIDPLRADVEQLPGWLLAGVGNDARDANLLDRMLCVMPRLQKVVQVEVTDACVFPGGDEIRVRELMGVDVLLWLALFADDDASARTGRQLLKDLRDSGVAVDFEDFL